MTQHVRQRPRDSAGTTVIDNALAVLRCFSAEEPLLGVTEIAQRVGLHKSSVSRILTTLENADLVERDTRSRRFGLGLGLLTVAGPLLATLDVRRAAYPFMQRLTAELDETSALVLWNGVEAVCVEQVPSPQPIKHTSALGTRYDTAASSCVQVFLAEEPAEVVTSLVVSGAVRLDHPSPQRLAEYGETLRAVAGTGVALNYGQTSPDEVGVCAGIRDHRGDLVAGLLVAAPTFRVDVDRARTISESVRATARDIGLRMGNVPG